MTVYVFVLIFYFIDCHYSFCFAFSVGEGQFSAGFGPPGVVDVLWKDAN